MRGLRTIPVMIAMGNEMASLCPDGLLLNYTNPMAMVPWGIWAGSNWPAANTIGVCHSVRDTHSFLAELVGVPEEQVEFLTAGFNHQCFVYVFRDRASGDDLYPRVCAASGPTPKGSAGACASRSSAVRVFPHRKFGALQRVRAVVPAPARPGGAVPQRDRRVHPAQRREPRRMGDPQGRARRGRRDRARAQRRARLTVHLRARDRDAGGAVRQRSERRLIDGLPTDACVEVPVTVADGAVQPRRVGPIPPQCLGLNRTFLNPVELTVRAVVEESREHVYHAALLDPNTASTLTTEQIVNMVDDLIEAHGELIPEPIRRG